MKPVAHLTYSNTVRLAIILLLWIPLITKVYGQELINRQSVYVDAFSLEAGLRQSMVSCVQQDPSGLIWVASGDGLHCFDGKRFKAFRIPYQGSFHHSDNMMRMITGTKTGDLMISSSSSLFRFNPATAEFKFINREMSVYVILFDVQINTCSLAWTLKKGLCLTANDSLVPLNITYSNGLTPPAGFIPTKALRLNNSTVLILGKEGIINLSVTETNIETSLKSQISYTATWEPVPDCKLMASDKQGNVFIIQGTTFYKYLSKGKWKAISNPQIPIGLVFFIDHMNNFWFTDNKNQLFRLNSNGITTIELLENSGKLTDTIKTDIKYIFEDKSNILWFGTDGSGLLKYNPEKIMFNKALIGFTRCLTSVENEIFAGTYNNGLWRLSEDLADARRLNPEVFDNNEYILDLTSDDRKRIWAVTRKGLYILTKEGDVVLNYPGECTTARFIFSTGSTVELYKDTELLTFSAAQIPKLKSISGSYEIRSHISAFNRAWVATPTGLYVYSRNSGIKENKTPGTILSGSETFTIVKVKSEIWAATGNGVEVFSAAGNKINSYKAVEQLRNEAIYSLLPDKEGRLWFIGLRGLGFINASKDRVIRFSQENNLQSLEFNQNATCVTENGMFCFGGINGLNSINPSNLKAPVIIPQIRIFSLMVSDTNYSAGTVPARPVIQLDRRLANIEGSVFSTNYSEAGHSGFSFLLEGYQSNWTEPSSDGTFSYRNLQPGDYRLFVKYTGMLQNEGSPQLILTVFVAPAFWQQPLFYTGLILLIIVATVLIVRRVQSIRYENKIKELEREKAIERERTRISKDMHDEVGASLTRISILTELAKKQQGHSQKSDEIIDKISIIAGDVVDELSEIIWAMNPKNDNLETFAAYIRRYAGTYLESTGISIKFDFPEKIPTLLMTAEIRRNLFLIIKEALHNTVKHAEANNVLLKISIKNTDLTIVVKDDGKGFVMHSSIGIRHSLLDKDNTVNLKTTLLNKGNGLQNMQFRATELGGYYNINTGSGSGTEISITVSL